MNRFPPAYFRRFCVESLDSTKIRSVKTALRLKTQDFRVILGAEDAALLTQGKDDKPKSAGKMRFEAAQVRRSSPYRDWCLIIFCKAL